MQNLSSNMDILDEVFIYTSNKGHTVKLTKMLEYKEIQVFEYDELLIYSYSQTDHIFRIMSHDFIFDLL